MGRRGAACAIGPLCGEARFDLDGSAEGGCEWIERVETLDAEPPFDDARSIRSLIAVGGAFVALIERDGEPSSIAWRDEALGSASLALDAATPDDGPELLDLRRSGEEGEERLEVLARAAGALSLITIDAGGARAAPLSISAAPSGRRSSRASGEGADTILVNERRRLRAPCAPARSTTPAAIGARSSRSRRSTICARSPRRGRPAAVALSEAEIASCDSCALERGLRRSRIRRPRRRVAYRAAPERRSR